MSHQCDYSLVDISPFGNSNVNSRRFVEDGLKLSLLKLAFSRITDRKFPEKNSLIRSLKISRVFIIFNQIISRFNLSVKASQE